MAVTLNNLREFEALRAVISTGTTTAAARRLGISQSSVSRSLAQLEARIGHTLFDREAGRITPTAAALNLNGKLDPLFDALARINGEDWASESDSVLRIMATATLAHRFLLKRIAGFLDGGQGPRVSLDVGSSNVIEESILQGHADLGVTAGSISRAGLKLLPFRYSRAVCLMAPDHPLANRETVRAEDLEGRALVALSRRLRVRIELDRILAAAGITPKVVAEVATSVAGGELARAGLGLAIVNPFPLIQGGEHGIVVRSFEPAIEYRTGFVVNSDRPPSGLARLFMRHVRLTMPKLPHSSPL